jgi:hypothetical protein
VRQIIVAGAALACGLSVSDVTYADPVVYTLYTVSDGMLGAESFTEAKLTITFRGDTRNIQTATVNGATVYTNHIGTATVAVTQGGKTTVAKFADQQVYVRYDVTNGLVGFGSGISATFPITLGCGIADCTAGTLGNSYYYQDGISAVLADAAVNSADRNLLTQRVLTQHATLSRNSILTGYTLACAVPYTLNAANNFVCQSAPSSPLATDHGGFYLQDLNANPGELANWGNGNTAVFTVAVTAND